MYQRILVPFDGSATSGRGLDEAIRLAAVSGATVRLVHMVDVSRFATGFETPKTYLDEVVPMMCRAGQEVIEEGKTRVESAGLKAEGFLTDDSGCRLSDLVSAQVKAWNADLVVIGTHGRRGFNRLMLGSDAEQIVRTCPVPVLLVRAAKSHVDPRSGSSACAPTAADETAVVA